MMMRAIYLTGLFISMTLYIHAYEKRDLLQRTIDPDILRKTLRLNQDWVSYPEYHDRAGWDALTGSLKQDLIAKGEQALAYEWHVVKATDYLEFERTGDRGAMERLFSANLTAQADLVLAELAEGKGRFLDQIANGIWCFCEKTSWMSSAHMGHYTRKAYASLPDYNEFVIDIRAGDLGSLFAWTYYFLKDDLDKHVHPLIATRLRKNLQERILDPYMNVDHSWHVFDATPQTKVNNWTPWISFNAITAFLLLENDPEKLTAAVMRSLRSVDHFINYYDDDGACEEGTSYFGHAVGKMYDYLQLLQDAGVPLEPVFKNPLLKRMGEYVADAYIGDGWIVNYADAHAQYRGPIGVIYRYGEAVDSDKMKQFASYLFHRDESNDYVLAGVDIFRTIENMKSHQAVQSVSPSVSHEPYSWYPNAEQLFIRNRSDFFFAAKGGTNQQSHNHNDVGSFVLFYKNKPVFIDAGTEAYTRKTFSSERYSIWSLHSDYHNVPKINGVSQRSLGRDRAPDEEKHRARDVRFDADKLVLSMDISGSYHPDSKAERWTRRYRLTRPDKIVIEDEFVLTESVAPNQLNLMTPSLPDISQAGKVRLQTGNETITLSYKSAEFDVRVEKLAILDRKLRDVWGDRLYRISFDARKLEAKGRYVLSVAAE